MPDRQPRRALVIFHEVAEHQVAALDDAALARLDPHLTVIALCPDIAGVRLHLDSPVLEYAEDGVRIAYLPIAFDTIVLIAHVEVH
ncbi:hypothetical protein ACFVVX_20375 [Kitasatospora sp. NPDC058170]|uniref:hypothetical protein n=1 Tax=Kitasatospora sp. NPDC058170 TaxID=3346364 RepID=UPI0036D8AE92